MLEGSNRLTRGVKTNDNDPLNFQYLKFGEVMAVDDPLGLDRVKVWIKGSVTTGGDDELLGEGVSGYDALPWCLPLLPKHLSIKPKVGEMVLIFLLNKQKESADRLYIGPIISQLINLVLILPEQLRWLGLPLVQWHQTLHQLTSLN